MPRLVFVLLDGLRLDVALDAMGSVQAHAEACKSPCVGVRSELPSLSRPIYETLMTGVPPARSGITGNLVVRRSCHVSVFDQCRRAGKVTAAAAYHWFSELYNKAPFEHEQRHTNDLEAAIQFGSFYWQDGYPDDHLFADGQALRRRHAPDFLLIHSMAIDDSGHRHGGGSAEYAAAARRADALLALYMPGWLDAGDLVVVTSDHGMGDDGKHGGPTAQETEVPFWLLGAGERAAGIVLRQTEIAGTVCALIGVGHDGMDVNAGLL